VNRCVIDTTVSKSQNDRVDITILILRLNGSRIGENSPAATSHA
jgi:hypothetical protein